MRRMVEIAAFLGLSAAVHAGVMAGIGEEIGGPQGEGAQGADRVSLQAAPESLAMLVDRWIAAPEITTAQPAMTPPDTSDQPPDFRHEPAPPTLIRPTSLSVPRQDTEPNVATPAPTPPRPTAIFTPTAPSSPQLTTPVAPTPRTDVAPQRSAPVLVSPMMPADTRPDSASPPPASSTRLAIEVSPRPPQRPLDAVSPVTEAALRTAATSAPQPARIAAGQGTGSAQGAAATPATTALSPGQRQNLMSQWGAQILARIERARPRVRGTGQVTLALRIARTGQLAGVSVARSSGDPSLDQAALSAVQRVGRFPSAPEGLTDASYGFSLPVRFR